MPQEILTLADLLTRPEFLVGLTAGAVAAAFFLLIPSKRIPGWGVAFVLSAIIGVSVTVGQRVSLISGLILLGVGAWLTDRGGTDSERRYNPGWLVVMTGAVLLALRGGSSPLVWTWVVTPIVIVAAGAALTLWSIGPHRTLLGVLVAISAFGIWATIPNTDTARAVLGVSIPLALATTSKFGALISRAGAYPLAGLLVVMATDGGHHRPASIVGGWASLGILVLLPAIVASLRCKPVLSNWQLLAVHAGLVLVASRVIGMWSDPIVATAAVAGLWGGGTILLTRLRVFNPTPIG